MPGLGTLLNVATVLAGSALGVLIGERLPQRVRDLVTDGIGLVTLMVAVLDGASVLDPSLRRAVGAAAPVLIVLGSILIGGISGSLLRIEDRLDALGAILQRRLSRPLAAGTAAGPPAGEVPVPAPRPPVVPASSPGAADPAAAERDRFIRGFVTASLIYCVGPLTILGSLQDGLGRGISQLALKSTLDGFTSIALAASLGWGVAAAALSVLVIQGGLTAAAAALGGLLSGAQIAAMTATGGLLLAGIAFRLLRLRPFAVADLLPALVAAPVITEIVTLLR
jgi:uncharacterized membrane protein YqgA involved in biofilm formation